MGRIRHAGHPVKRARGPATVHPGRMVGEQQYNGRFEPRARVRLFTGDGDTGDGDTGRDDAGRDRTQGLAVGWAEMRPTPRTARIAPLVLTVPSNSTPDMASPWVCRSGKPLPFPDRTPPGRGGCAKFPESLLSKTGILVSNIDQTNYREAAEEARTREKTKSGIVTRPAADTSIRRPAGPARLEKRSGGLARHGRHIQAVAAWPPDAVVAERVGVPDWICLRTMTKWLETGERTWRKRPRPKNVVPAWT